MKEKVKQVWVRSEARRRIGVLAAINGMSILDWMDKITGEKWENVVDWENMIGGDAQPNVEAVKAATEQHG